jgi:hypothetical protein
MQTSSHANADLPVQCTCLWWSLALAQLHAGAQEGGLQL